MSKKICVLGDSVVQGYSDLEKGGWVNRLNIFLGERYKEFNVFNLGIAGETSNDLLKRIEKELKDRKSDVIIISVGINDALIENNVNWVDEKKFEENLEKILEISQKFTSEIIFVGIFRVDEKFAAPVDWDDLFYYNKELKKYDLDIELFCKKKNITFIPMQDLLKSSDLSNDGLHPNAQGHEKIFQRVKKCLEENKII
jgi:lysophospholipase L1-like esterase